MSDLLVASKVANWLEKNNGLLGCVSLGVVVLSIVAATLYFAPRTDLSEMRADISRIEASVAKIQSDVSLIQQDTASIKKTQQEHSERFTNIERRLGAMYERLNGIDDRFNIHMSGMHVLGERVNKNEQDILRLQNAQ